jgi:hypothetical protein
MNTRDFAVGNVVFVSGRPNEVRRGRSARRRPPKWRQGRMRTAVPAPAMSARGAKKARVPTALPGGRRLRPTTKDTMEVNRAGMILWVWGGSPAENRHALATRPYPLVDRPSCQPCGWRWMANASRRGNGISEAFDSDWVKGMANDRDLNALCLIPFSVQCVSAPGPLDSRPTPLFILGFRLSPRPTRPHASLTIPEKTSRLLSPHVSPPRNAIRSRKFHPIQGKCPSPRSVPACPCLKRGRFAVARDCPLHQDKARSRCISRSAKYPRATLPCSGGREAYFVSLAPAAHPSIPRSERSMMAAFPWRGTGRVAS